MKKVFIAILATFYLGVSTGATVHIHYCMGKLVEWSLWHNKKADRCSRCGMTRAQKQASKGCCKDEHKVIKIVNDQKATESANQIIQFSSVVIASPFIELPGTVISSVTEENPLSNAPPRSCDIGIYLLHSVFRI